MTYETMMADVLAWMDVQGLARVTLLGHSLGGKVAMRLACVRPERVERLIVVDIAPKAYRSHAHRAEFAAMNELRLEGLASRRDAELRFEARVDDWAMRKFLVTNLERTEAGEWRWVINLPSITAALPELEQSPLAETDRFDGPALFVVGGKSGYVRPEDHAAIRKHFPRARIETILEAGHNPHMETRAELVRLIHEGRG